MKTMKETCEYTQFLSSNPDIVISMIGGKDSMNYKNFTPEGFSAKYSEFIKMVKAMPSSPELLLISPIYNAASVVALD